MGGSSIDDEWDFTAPNEVRTMVLVGRAGSGKSATGNSILGREVFKSEDSFTGVTRTCELQSTVLGDGQVLNVIDTPGLFDFSGGFDIIGKEIISCIDLAKNGLHAIIVVLSVRNRFTEEEEATLKKLQNFFAKLNDYMIVVFTGGDDLEYNKKTLDSYLRECPEGLQGILRSCKLRMVVFNNRTNDENKKAEQLHQLLSLVNVVIAENGGKPYAHEFFTEIKRREGKLHAPEGQDGSIPGYSKQVISELKEQMNSSYEV